MRYINYKICIPWDRIVLCKLDKLTKKSSDWILMDAILDLYWHKKSTKKRYDGKYYVRFNYKAIIEGNPLEANKGTISRAIKRLRDAGLILTMQGVENTLYCRTNLPAHLYDHWKEWYKHVHNLSDEDIDHRDTYDENRYNRGSRTDTAQRKRIKQKEQKGYKEENKNLKSKNKPVTSPVAGTAASLSNGEGRDKGSPTSSPHISPAPLPLDLETAKVEHRAKTRERLKSKMSMSINLERLRQWWTICMSDAGYRNKLNWTPKDANMARTVFNERGGETTMRLIEWLIGNYDFVRSHFGTSMPVVPSVTVLRYQTDDLLMLMDQKALAKPQEKTELEYINVTISRRSTLDKFPHIVDYKMHTRHLRELAENGKTTIRVLKKDYEMLKKYAEEVSKSGPVKPPPTPVKVLEGDNW